MSAASVLLLPSGVLLLLVDCQAARLDNGVVGEPSLIEVSPAGSASHSHPKALKAIIGFGWLRSLMCLRTISTR